MPLGFANAILTKTAVTAGAAATGTDNGGFWNSEFKSNDSQKAKHVVIDAGSGNDWHDSTNGKFQIMWWSKGTTSDFNSDGKQVVLRTNSDFSGDSGIFVEFASDHVQAGTQVGSGGGSFHFFKWSPSGFATDYLDDNWHHFLFEIDGTSSKLFVDGVDKTSEAVDNNIGGAAQNEIGGTTRYAFIGGSTTARNDGSYNGFRTGTFQFCDVWFSKNTTGNLASNISSIYNSGWVDLGADGRLNNTLPAPDIFVYAASDGNSLGSALQSGASLTTVEGSGGNANLIISNTNGPAQVDPWAFVVVSGGSLPTLDTSTKKIGAGSFAFSGSNQGLELGYSQVQLAGTDPWTCEFWAKQTASANYAHLCGHWTGATSDRSWSFGIRSNNKYFFNHTNGSGSAQSQEGSNTFTTSDFHYYSASYDGSQVFIHIDGVHQNTISISGGFNEPASNVNFTLGVMDNLGDDFTGNIDMFRMSKIARYNASAYTAPTSAHSSDSNTLNLTQFDSDLTNSASHSGTYGV